MNSIFNRRSIRKYQDKPIEKEVIDRLLRAAMQAPSAGNQQPWEFLVVKNREVLKKMTETANSMQMLSSAGVGFVILGNKTGLKYPEHIDQDLSAATQNILLEAVNLDLGAVWLGVAPQQERMDFLKNLFSLPDHIRPFAIVSVGYPAQENKFIDRYRPDKVHYETW